MKLPPPIQKFIDDFKELPSIGPRQATRLAFYMIAMGKSGIRTLAEDIANLGLVKTCTRCFFIHQNAGDLCDICGNPARDQSIIMLIEKETDLISLEQTHKFMGRYIIIGQIPKTEMLESWQKLRLEALKSFIKNPPPAGLGGQAEEIILALNPTSGGDTSATLLKRELEPFAKKISRLGKGLPAGGEIEFADDETLGSALERRI